MVGILLWVVLTIRGGRSQARGEAMVEILLWVVLTILSLVATVWPWVTGEGHTVDGLFLTSAGLLMSTIFFCGFVYETRSEIAAVMDKMRSCWSRTFSVGDMQAGIGGEPMREVTARMRFVIVATILVLTVLVSPATLCAGREPRDQQPCPAAVGARNTEQHLFSSKLLRGWVTFQGGQVGGARNRD